ncbi:hypothetical protein TRVL_05793 [Trypanosoma vivax]|uniref:Uncharacterized protein n=1 Tax=Trypanosoma vivax (strain Y486) TaxID=1055687 RepID=G0U6U0_TRYVY|nr:hypothetical protein TRVL_05793 [Trypanosoma vivax]CCC51595.1 conserved hypothetical protein [Trypanosoma vivax Y486]
MSGASPGFMPPLTHHNRNKMLGRIRPQHKSVLQHSVITFGSTEAGNRTVPFDSVVEGVRTGEERVLPKESDKQRRCSDELDSANRRVQQLGIELQQALEKLRQKAVHEQKLKRMVSIYELRLEEAATRQHLIVEGLFLSMAMCWSYWSGRSGDLRRVLDQLESERDEAASALKSARAENMQLVDKLRDCDAFRLENGGLKLQVSRLEDEVKRLRAVVSKMEWDRGENELSFSSKQCKLESDLMRAQEEVQRLSCKLKEAQDEKTALDVMTEQVRLFVQLICQPNFFVVKDATLQPVDRNRAEPTGYVLVPLTVLLQGFSLLPTDDRDAVIESYKVHLP